MFRRLLIANRGEIACRVIRTARRMGIHTIAVYSDADHGARHVRLADQAVRLGPAPAKESYLVIEKILAAAKESGAEAIHPGYGFLSENADFAEACEKAGIIFVGPPASAIRAMGSKSAAKTLMEKADVPLTPGYHGDDQNPAALKEHANRIGYPVLIKASSGGGGKGMRRVDQAADFESALASCQREAKSAFNSDKVLVEKYVVGPRHIEIQVFGDAYDNYVYLFERDCSVQRRHQKVLEEAPAPGMTEERRKRMGDAAVAAARAVKYVGAGTVEFISDQEGRFYFMEMNTRLQVEHPVTEKISGQDLVEWQLRVASGERLPLSQSQLAIHGHAIEARIYAENPDTGFLPQIGTLTHLSFPPPSENVRIDTGVSQGDTITSNYDPMIAKLIVWGRDRGEALAWLANALERCRIVGLTSNVEFLDRLVHTESFSKAKLDTGLIEKEHAALFPPAPAVPDDVWRFGAAAELARAYTKEGDAPFDRLDAFRLGGAGEHSVSLRHLETTTEIRSERLGRERWRMRIGSGAPETVIKSVVGEYDVRLEIDGRSVHAAVVPHATGWNVFFERRKWVLERVDPLYVESTDDAGGAGIRAPMPGKVIAHLVTPGTKVEKGQPLLMLESMKMELTISSPKAGVLVSFRYAPGDQVNEGEPLVELGD